MRGKIKIYDDDDEMNQLARGISRWYSDNTLYCMVQWKWIMRTIGGLER